MFRASFEKLNVKHIFYFLNVVKFQASVIIKTVRMKTGLETDICYEENFVYKYPLAADMVIFIKNNSS